MIVNAAKTVGTRLAVPEYAFVRQKRSAINSLKTVEACINATILLTKGMNQASSYHSNMPLLTFGTFAMLQTKLFCWFLVKTPQGSNMNFPGPCSFV